MRKQALGDDFASVQSAYDDVASDYERALGPDAVSTLRADFADFATQHGLIQGNWSRAVSDIVASGATGGRQRFLGITNPPIDPQPSEAARSFEGDVT